LVGRMKNDGDLEKLDFDKDEVLSYWNVLRSEYRANEREFFKNRKRSEYIAHLRGRAKEELTQRLTQFVGLRWQRGMVFFHNAVL